MNIVTTKTYKFNLLHKDGTEVEDFIFVQTAGCSIEHVQAEVDRVCKEKGLYRSPTYSVSISERYLIDDPNSPL